MGRLLKLVGIVAAAVVVLMIVAAVLVGVLFDPNDYKQQLTAAVANQTGRELTIDGDLDLQVFPNIQIEVGPATLSNAAGFTARNFASINGARLSVALLPLLAGRIAVAEARLDGLELNLERNASGGTNWQDLGGTTAPAQSPAPDTAAGRSGATTGGFDLDIDSISVTDAQVSWRDAATGTDWQLNDFSMAATGFGLGRAFPVDIDFSFTGPDIDVTVESGMQATLDLAANSYRLDNLDVSIDGGGDAWPGGKGSATLRFRTFAANLDAQTLELDDLLLKILGLDISGTLHGEKLFDDLTLNGEIEIAEFDPHDLLNAFDTEIETADPDVFRTASARADFHYDARQMGMRDTEISLDDSTLSGSLGLDRDVLRFDLDVDKINIDRYLPPATGDTSAPPDEGSIDEVDLPLDPLKELRANGNFSLGETQFMGLTMTDANFALSVDRGRMHLVPTASLYDGSIEGAVDITVVGDSAEFSLEQKLSRVDLHGLAADYLGTEDLSGTGNVNLDLTSTGANLGEIRKTLTGTASFSLIDGAWEGIDAWYELRRARAVTQSNKPPAREGAARTTFSNVSASGTVADGVLTTNDLNATLPFMTLDGQGKVGLFDNTLDFTATAMLVDGPTLQSDPAMADLAGASLPLTVGGTLDAPSIRPDFGKLVRARIQSAVDERREEIQNQAEEEVRDRVRDRLKGLINR